MYPPSFPSPYLSPLSLTQSPPWLSHQVPYDITIDWPLMKPYVPFVLQLAAQNGLGETLEDLLGAVDLSILLGDALNTDGLGDADLLALVLLLSDSDLGLDIDPSTIEDLEDTVANSTAATDLIKAAFNVSVDSFFGFFDFFDRFFRN